MAKYRLTDENLIRGNRQLRETLSLIERMEHRGGLLTELFDGAAGSVQYQSGIMQGAYDNGVGKGTGQQNIQWNQQVFDYLGKQETYFGEITRLAQERNTTYPQLIEDLHNKVKNFLENGYFGQNQEVTGAVTSFLQMLAYMRGIYESAMTRAMKQLGLVGESYLREANLKDAFNNAVYSDENMYGIKQKVSYNGQDGQTVNDYRGQWIEDLRNELQQMLQFKFLHGPKTVEATQALMQLLIVNKRGILDPTKRQQMFNASVKKLRMSLVGIAAIAALASSLSMCTGGNQMAPQQQQQPAQIQQVQQQQQQTKVGFAKNQSTLSQQDIQKLNQLGRQGGTYKIIVHEIENANGQDASYENQLVQARANAVIQALGNGVNTVVERGANVAAQGPAVVEIAPA